MSMDSNPMHDHDYSGHSIDDRIIDALERMMDEAKTEHEREKIMRRIDYIRRDK